MSAFLSACRRKSRRGIQLKPRHDVKHRAAFGLNLVTEPADPKETIKTATETMTMEVWLSHELRRLTAKGQHVEIVPVGNKIAIRRTR